MATVNLGAIKFNWKGAYAGGTAYVADDVVSYLGSSYVCILASTGNVPTNGTYWNQMSSAGTNGTNGTDLTSTLTTQGDIVYRDGSGLARLGYGTSGNVLTTKGSGQNPVWEAASGGKVLQVVFENYGNSTSVTTSSTSYVNFPSFSATITPSATSSKILVQATFNGVNVNNSATNSIINIERGISGGSNTLLSDKTLGLAHTYSTDMITVPALYLDSPNTTSAIVYQPQLRCDNSSYVATGHRGNSTSTLVLMEIGA